MKNEIPQLEDGYARIANEILEKLSAINMSSYQTRILFFIFRKTYGYGKREDWISVSQMVNGTGIKKSHVSRTKKQLVLRKIITSNGNKIAFQKDSSQWRKLPSQVTVTAAGNQVAYSGQKVTNTVQELPVKENTIETTHKIITKNNIQKKYNSLTTLTDQVLEEIAQRYNVPLSFVRSKLDDMSNWLKAKGKTYKDYKHALMNWVKTDSLKIIQKERQMVNKFTVTKV